MHAFLLRWRTLLDWSRLKPLIDFWELLMRGVEGVVAWARFHLTNAALEGNNSRVRGLSQRAHGYCKPRNLMLVLYHASWQHSRSHHPNARWATLAGSEVACTLEAYPQYLSGRQTRANRW